VLNGPETKHRHAGNANLRFSEFSAQDILSALQPHVAASTGAACTSGIPEPSHVLRAIGLNADEADASIRLSVGRYTSEEDIDYAVQHISDVLQRLAGAGLAQSDRTKKADLIMHQ
jgi:cysteine desulfurase